MGLPVGADVMAIGLPDGADVGSVVGLVVVGAFVGLTDAIGAPVVCDEVNPIQS